MEHTRWVQFEVPLFVRVELDDVRGDDRVTHFVLALPDSPPYDGVELARDENGYLVYDGGPDAAMARVSSDDRFARAAVGRAERRERWPDPDDWEESPNPRWFPGLYADGDGDLDGDEDDIEWTSLR